MLADDELGRLTDLLSALGSCRCLAPAERNLVIGLDQMIRDRLTKHLYPQQYGCVARLAARCVSGECPTAEASPGRAGMAPDKAAR